MNPEEQELFSNLYKQYDFTEVEIQMQQIFPKWELSFDDLLHKVESGNILELGYEIIKEILIYAGKEAASMRYLVVTLLIIGILSAVIMNLKNIFPKQQIGEFSFQYIYLILIVFLMNVGTECILVVKEGMEELLLFLKIFLPTYFLVVGAAGGTVTAFHYYQLFLLAIFIAENILVTIIVPLIGCYILICIMNGIWDEERLTSFAKMIKRGIKFTLKTMIAIITGSGMIQSLITPVIDTVKLEGIKKTVELIPGIGEVAGGSIHGLIGISILLKNTVGVIFLILLLGICTVSILKIFFVMMVMKTCSGILGIAADKKIVNCINLVGDGISLLVQTLFTGVTFFVLLLLIVMFTTNRGIV